VRREAPVKKIVLLGLAAAFLVVAFARWHVHPPAAPTFTSSSQIYIHGTPICVFTLGGNVVAQVGQCPDTPGAEKEDPGEEAPFRGQPGMGLPPGHPPVDRDWFPDGQRTVPI
jgi:hypothetical protein